MDPDEHRRGGGPRRAPGGRQGGPSSRGRSGPRRAAPGRAGTSRPRTPSRRPQRPERTPPPPPYLAAEDEIGAYDPPRDAPPPRPRKTRKGRRRGGFGPKLYFGAAAVLGLLVLAGLGAVVLQGDEDGAAPRPTPHARIGKPVGNGPSPDSYSNSPSTSAYAGIASRGSDAAPLTVGEAFPASVAELSAPGGDGEKTVTVKLRATRLDADCAAAVWGTTIGNVLGKGGCTQAARGIYSDTKNGYALAVTVFNLAGSADADRFVAALEETLGAGFVRPLEAPAPLDGFGRGYGMARGLAMGHFAVITWAERLNDEGGEGGGAGERTGSPSAQATDQVNIGARNETLLSLLIEGGKAPAVLGRAARASN
ncbi:hypothetical protein BZB76_2967 [Actinomadura pelletieri DSM 43383]|uniref:LytR cell envelope-related transcriptional attenuator n=1 Tax=Actinomadura pelletieri DSM 43383 TaxID=1120940 RepID=A0A495QN93_9ACTN|nr:hypothetical protein [Actinomadura pelletieri]RKS74453.1 hypothetical protein BZB76_2967 [Actinomadura pelletieri DSM 43383]